MALAAALVAGGLFGLAWFEFGKFRETQREQSARGRVHLALSARSQLLITAVERRLTLLDGLHAFVELQIGPGDLARTFPAFASRLQSVVPGVRNLGVARGSVYELVYPVEGNQKIVGYDPLVDPRPDVRDDVQRMLESGSSVVSGPLQLVQGGPGLIARRALRHEGRVWGFVAVVVDLGPILEEAGIARPAGDLEVAVRAAGQPAFAGPNRLFTEDAVHVKVMVPGTNWEMAARPASGWDPGRSEERRVWLAAGLILATVPMTLVFVLAWRQRVRAGYHLEMERLVEERTADLARTSVIVENSPVVLVRWRQGQGWPVEYVSDNIAQFGYAADDFHSGRLRWADILFAGDLPRIEEELRRNTEAGVRQGRQEYRLVTADGRIRWMEDRTTVMDGADGCPRAQGIIFDVTERKQREEAQREAEHRLRGILDRVQLIALMLDVSGRVTFCNRYLLALTGWSQDAVVGRDWFDVFVPPGDRAGARQRVEDMLATGQAGSSYENPVLLRDGSQRDVVWDNVPIRETSGQVIGVASFGRDMTEQRRLEHQYRQAQKMEAVGQLAGGIAHDFNNLLQVIGGYANLVLDDLPAGAPVFAEVTEIKRATDRATALVRQLLAFSRRQTMERKRIQPNDTVADLLKMLHRVIGEHIELDFRPGHDVPSVLADPGQIEQVLVNLCVNARDAMPDGGRLTISTARAQVDDAFCEAHAWARTGEFAVIQVADSGPGIPPGVIEHIFEPFFTTKEVGKGTGLGLATVYGIVKQHEGMIDVATPPEGGAVFRIFFPASIEAAASDEPGDASASSRAGHETILLAEDEELVRNLALRVLEHAGYRVLEARDGAEAIALVESRGDEIDLALLDVVMPKASGPQVWARIREIQPGMALLYCSGYSRQTLVETDLAADDHGELLLKPYAPRLLLDRVRGVLARAQGGARRGKPSHTAASPTS
jgi:PAS domain S-box-containing protein